VNVQCTDPAGTPADTQFDLTYAVRATPGDGQPNADQPPFDGAFAWASHPLSAGYTPSATYSTPLNGQRTTLARNSKGFYVWSFPANYTPQNDTMLVSAYGFTSNYCKVFTFVPQGANIACFNPNGKPADTEFTVSIFGQEQAPK
jgi:hypothetical protein